MKYFGVGYWICESGSDNTGHVLVQINEEEKKKITKKKKRMT